MQITVKKGLNNSLRVTVPYHPLLLQVMRKIPGRKWNRSEQCWNIPDTRDTGSLLLEKLFSTGLFSIEDTEENSMQAGIRSSREKPDSKAGTDEDQFTSLIQYLKRKNYSRSTVKTYLRELTLFFKRTNLSPEEVRTEDINLYLEKLWELGVCSRSRAVLCVSALKQLYRNGGTFPMNPADRVVIPKRDHKYPDILSRREVHTIISGPKNSKHRFLLALTYSAGLRVGEAVNLRLNDLDTDRGMIHIRQSKGKKDRYAMYSSSLIPLYDEYTEYYKLRDWLFPGADPDCHLSVRSAQKVFERARDSGGIKKNVTIHSLRHAFATHLLEDGVDLRYIQELLGHKSSKTTEMYTHVARKQIRNIRSPLESLGEKIGDEGIEEREG